MPAGKSEKKSRTDARCTPRVSVAKRAREENTRKGGVRHYCRKGSFRGEIWDSFLFLRMEFGLRRLGGVM